MSGGVRVGTRQIDYGWVIVAALSVTETVTCGIVYYGFPVFFRPMEAELGASRVAVTAAFSIGLGVSALAGIPVGRWIDAHGPRGIMTFGSCLASLLTLAWARVESVGALYAVWFGLGLAMAATLYEPAFAAVVSWFRRGRECALLTVTLAAVLAVITIPIHALLLRRGPAAPVTSTAPGDAPPSSMTLGEAGRTLVFWVLFVAFFVGNFATAAITTHLIPYLVEHGDSAALAAAVIGWTGAMQLPGRMLFVPIAARLGARAMVGAVFFAQALGLGQLPFLVRFGTLLPFIVLQGAANGMATLARASSLVEIFGSRNYGAIGGAIALGANGARAAGPVGASLLLGGRGSYVSVFWALSVSLVLAGALVLFVGRETTTTG